MIAPIDDFEIAPYIKRSTWLGLNIQDNLNSSPDWEKALRIFEARMNGRFLNQIRALVGNSDQRSACFSGFAIVALDCLLIETLAQFYNGQYETPAKRSKKLTSGLVAGEKSVDPHVEAFHQVFQKSVKLKGFFNGLEKTKVFYKQIRCGLLHQAQTKGKSKIHRRILAPAQWCDESKPEVGVIIHPVEFHGCVKDVYAGYLAELEDSRSLDLRDKFRKKMNFIANIE